jgi:ATP-dependent DNA ligase
VLDGEILMMNTVTGVAEPFSAMGVHKRAKFKDAVPCYVVFDILYYNGVSFLNTPLLQRRKLLEALLLPVKYHIELSEQHLLTGAAAVQVGSITLAFVYLLTCAVFAPKPSLFIPSFLSFFFT